ncbi:MAG: glycosyltransferase, partial [Hyphomonadaceae bacterium]|nr:glycosyltransferase [Hyphomonadaceae bacterium]
MRIAIVCNDTRGGVQPYVALGLGLKRAGHDVRALAPGGLETMFTEAGVEATALTGSVDDLRTLVSGVAERGSLAAMRLSVRELPRRIETWTREALAVCEGADIVTGGVGGMVVGLSAAEKAGARFVETHLQPVGRPTGDYPGVLAPHVPPWPERQWRLLS